MDLGVNELSFSLNSTFKRKLLLVVPLKTMRNVKLEVKNGSILIQTTKLLIQTILLHIKNFFYNKDSLKPIENPPPAHQGNILNS